MMNMIEYQRKWRENHPGYTKKAMRKWRKNNPERAKQTLDNWRKNNPDYALMWCYGITKDQVDQLRIKQGNRCDICKKSFGNNTPYVDHDHETNQVRGLLCNRCNLILGQINDSIIFLSDAISYLERYKSKDSNQGL